MVTPFPFEKLTQYKTEEVSLLKKLFNAYYYAESRSHMIEDILEPLQKILKTPLTVTMAHVAPHSLEDLQTTLSGNALFGVVSIEPQMRKAVVVFEALLAKLMVNRVLAGEKQESEKKLLGLQVKSITVLEEAIVQYILISMIERFSLNIQLKTFSLKYDGVFHDAGCLKQYFPKDEPLAVFSVQLQFLERDFFVKLVMPVKATDGLGMTKTHEQYLRERLIQFGRFSTEYCIEAADVTLMPSDIEKLAEGDIILFDESHIHLQGKEISGLAKLKLNCDDYQRGFMVELQSSEDNLAAKIVSGLS
ncbi:MAG: hypothetical protein HQM16_06155 [Deltaproteobacteria bacterium]|nr:hypothetical protein [Deltaproteobacteria bacterium]